MIDTRSRNSRPTPRRLAFLALAPLLGVAFASCSTGTHADGFGDAVARVEAPRALPRLAGSAYEEAARVALEPTKAENHESLHNVFKLGTQIWSGSEPHGEDAFRILAAKKIRTILSVDGKVPDAALAAKYGMRYVHVPIQYRGISDPEIARIAKTFRELPGPFFVHCFHGRHRGPAAAAVGRLVVDGAERETALAEMRQWCGTSENYEGLYRTIAHAAIPSAEETEALAFDFPAAHEMDGVAAAMIDIVRVRDRLKDLRKRDWRPDPKHPDVDAAQEAATMLSLFERLAKLDASEYEEDYSEWMQDSVQQARVLRDGILAQRSGPSTSLEHISRSFDMLVQTCKACHLEYRN